MNYEDLARAAGIPNTATINPVRDRARFKEAVAEALQKDEITLIVAKSPCILAVGRIVAAERERAVWEAEHHGIEKSDCQAGGK